MRFFSPSELWLRASDPQRGDWKGGFPRQLADSELGTTSALEEEALKWSPDMECNVQNALNQYMPQFKDFLIKVDTLFVIRTYACSYSVVRKPLRGRAPAGE